MKINFTKKEYRLLLDMIEISEWVLNALSDRENSETKKYSELEQKILSYSKAMRCEDLIVFDKSLGEYYPTKKYEDDGDYMNFIEQFEEDVFWDSLSYKLALRDTLEELGESEFYPLDNPKAFSKVIIRQSEYQNEFESSGLLNIEIKNSGN